MVNYHTQTLLFRTHWLNMCVHLLHCGRQIKHLLVNLHSYSEKASADDVSLQVIQPLMELDKLVEETYTIAMLCIAANYTITQQQYIHQQEVVYNLLSRCASAINMYSICYKQGYLSQELDELRLSRLRIWILHNFSNLYVSPEQYHELDTEEPEQPEFTYMQKNRVNLLTSKIVSELRDLRNLCEQPEVKDNPKVVELASQVGELWNMLVNVRASFFNAVYAAGGTHTTQNYFHKEYNLINHLYGWVCVKSATHSALTVAQYVAIQHKVGNIHKLATQVIRYISQCESKDKIAKYEKKVILINEYIMLQQKLAENSQYEVTTLAVKM